MKTEDEAHPARCHFDPDGMAVRLDTTFQGVPSAIPPVVERIMGVVAEMGCAADHHFDIRLALSEALANAVLHGCRNDPGKTVEVAVECDPEQGMLIVVKDPGEGFDPAQVPSPVEGEQIYRDRGRGIFLINELMDQVEFHGGGTEIRMLKRHPEAGTEGGEI